MGPKDGGGRWVVGVLIEPDDSKQIPGAGKHL